MNGRFVPPFGGITERQRWTSVLACLGVLVAFGLVMTRRWPDSPGNIIDFELAGDAKARSFLLDWNTGEQRRAAQVILLDLPFLLAYGIGGALLLDGIARWSTGLPDGWVRFLRRAAWLPLAAAGFDVVEDVALLAVTANRTMTWPELARSMATVKFVLLDVFYLLVVVALVSALIARFRRETPEPATALAA